jgi:hypothetical protein
VELLRSCLLVEPLPSNGSTCHNINQLWSDLIFRNNCTQFWRLYYWYYYISGSRESSVKPCPNPCTLFLNSNYNIIFPSISRFPKGPLWLQFFMHFSPLPYLIYILSISSSLLGYFNSDGSKTATNLELKRTSFHSCCSGSKNWIMTLHPFWYIILQNSIICNCNYKHLYR